jgi:hypothetical protein
MKSKWSALVDDFRTFQVPGTESEKKYCVGLFLVGGPCAKLRPDPAVSMQHAPKLNQIVEDRPPHPLSPP